PGKVTYLGALNNTVSRTLTVSVSDGSLSTSTTSTIHLAPVNDVPTDIAVTPSNVPENNEPNVVVGTLSTTDPDVGDTFSYSLVTGAGDTDNGSFFIVGNILRITPGVDFETKPSYSIRVRSTEASTAFIEKALTINVRDLLEQEIAYDDFRRPSDSGNGWSTNWSVANPAVANLVYPPLNSGGQAAGSGAGQRFRTLGVAQTTGVVYVSALLKGGGYCNIALFDNSLEKVSFGVVYDPLRGTFNPNFGLFDETRRFEGGAAMVPTAVPIDSATHLILARVDLDLNTVEMWLDPNLALPLGAPNCTSRAGVASGGNYDFNRVRLEVTGTAVMDEPRIMAGDRRFVAERVTSASIASPSVTNVKNTRATLGGDISQTGGTAILERGVVYSATAVNSNPEVGGTGVFQATASGTSTGTFTVNVAGLVAGTNYRFKAYARNAIGTTYTLTTGSFQTLSVPESIPGDSGDVISNSLATGADGTSTIGNYGVLRRGGFLAENGVFAYPGYLLMGSGSPPVTTANNSGIWKVQGGNPLLVARTGTTVPDVPGALFATVPEVPGLSESGDVSMLSTLVIGSGGVTTANDTGLWSEIGGGGLRLLLREDDNIPSLPGVKVGSFASGVYATARTGASTGEAVFSVTYKGASTKTALLRTSVSGATTTVSVVAQEGEVAPGASPAANYVSVAGSYSDPGRMDAQGNFVYAALTTPGNKEGIWYQPVTGGTPNKVFFAGETAPGTGGATFARLQRPSMGSNGFISFRATLNRDGDNAANARNDGIWNGSASNPASFTCVLRRGDGVAKVSNLPVGSLVGNPWGGWLTNSNLGAWRAWLDVDGDGISSTADGDVNAIFANLSGAMQLAVKVGDAAPGTAGASFSGFDLPMVGGNNQYAILGNLTGGDTVTGNNQGLWKSGPNGGALTLAIRKGATITTTEGPKVVTKIDVPGSNQTDRRWEQPVMDSAGRMVVYVTFADGSTSQVIIP
ncbi:cadherin repeat domain-containing protein, partial [Prosthecobacter algae]|uniref:cadherin repeat domain-containing protein n=1 Tax=Prosthecobacter algae TaxID=1144682 RepID=UPI0031EEB6F8